MTLTGVVQWRAGFFVLLQIRFTDDDVAAMVCLLDSLTRDVDGGEHEEEGGGVAEDDKKWEKNIYIYVYV